MQLREGVIGALNPWAAIHEDRSASIPNNHGTPYTPLQVRNKATYRRSETDRNYLLYL